MLGDRSATEMCDKAAGRWERVWRAAPMLESLLFDRQTVLLPVSMAQAMCERKGWEGG
jgi:hypothetical protein